MREQKSWAFDKGKCEQRRFAAARREVEAAPIRFLPEAEAAVCLSRALGTLPQGMEGSLTRINSLLPENAEPLTAEDVYIHFLEAANGNFVSDRYMFLDGSTLRNCAIEGNAGRSLMNNHETGSMCESSKLPFGKTFCGRYEPEGNGRTLLGAYMLRGVRPNGDNGPSTDDLDRMIRGGVISDVSVGLWPGADGWLKCDVCGKDVYDFDHATGDWLCPHVPGTDYGMNKKEVEAQKARGVPTGYASYSLCNHHMGEVSSVFDGAVPGAGYKKALSFARDGVLSAESLALCRTAYSFAPESAFVARKGSGVRASGIKPEVLQLDSKTPRVAYSAEGTNPTESPASSNPLIIPRIGELHRYFGAQLGAIYAVDKTVTPNVIHHFAFDGTRTFSAEITDNPEGPPPRVLYDLSGQAETPTFDLRPASSVPTSDLENSAAASVAGGDGAPTAPDEGGEGAGSPASFSDELARALTAVSSCTQRAVSLKETRAADGRANLLSPKRWAQLQAIHAEIGTLLEATRPQPSRSEALGLRLSALQTRAAALPPPRQE